MTYRILITGSRTWERVDIIRAALRDRQVLHGALTVVHGHCPRGADAIAHSLCAEWGWESEPHPADWATHGRRAGFIRNQHMVDLGADECLAFIRDNSAGASHTASVAEKAGIPTVRFPYPIGATHG